MRGLVASIGGAVATVLILVFLALARIQWGDSGTGAAVVCFLGAALLFFVNLLAAFVSSLRKRTSPDLLRLAWLLMVLQVVFWGWLLVANVRNAHH